MVFSASPISAAISLFIFPSATRRGIPWSIGLNVPRLPASLLPCPVAARITTPATAESSTCSPRATFSNASPTHLVPANLYHTGLAGRSPRHIAYRQGWIRTTDGDHYVNGRSYFGIRLDVGEGNGAELFFTHFSFLGFDPRGRHDR